MTPLRLTLPCFVLMVCVWGEARSSGLPPPAGMEPIAQRSEAEDRFALPVAPLDDPAPPTQSVEGNLSVTAYRALPDAGVSPKALIDEYRGALGAAGWEMVYSCIDAACGGVRRRFTLDLLPAPGMLLDSADLSLLTMRHTAAPVADSTAAGEAASENGDAGAGGTSHLNLVASRVLGRLYLQVALITPPGGAAPPLDIAAPSATLPGDAATANPERSGTPTAADPDPEAAAGERAHGPGDAEADSVRHDGESDPAVLRDRLLSEGHLALTGIDFAIGTASIAPSSEAAIARAAAILQSAGDRLVAVVGHSDNSGALDANMALSRQRAEAVRDALVARGIAAGRLEAHGVGWLAPLAPNDTPAGRAQNRRVELVLR